MENINTNKVGVISRLRDDQYERDNRWTYGSYNYIVNYDDGTFEIYEEERNLIREY
jgi:hypothetical protein